MPFCKCVCGCVPEWVCVWVCLLWLILLIQLNMIRSDCHSTPMPQHDMCPLLMHNHRAWASATATGNNYNNNERRSVRTLTAAAATYTPEFSCDETKTGAGCVGGVCRHRRRRWHLLVVLWFYFECSPITTSLPKSGAGGQEGNGGTELVTLHHLTKLSIRLWALIEHSNFAEILLRILLHIQLTIFGCSISIYFIVYIIYWLSVVLAI